MFTRIRNTMLALAAIASLGLATLVTTTTSADAMRGGGGFSRGGGGHAAMRHVGGGRQMGGMRRIGIRHVGHRHPNWCRIHGRCHVHVRWHRPWIHGAGLVATSYAVAPITPRPCTCLTKEYTPDNLVVFKDVCTKEVASAPIGNTQAQLPLPQEAPTQQQ